MKWGLRAAQRQNFITLYILYKGMRVMYIVLQQFNIHTVEATRLFFFKPLTSPCSSPLSFPSRSLPFFFPLSLFSLPTFLHSAFSTHPA